MLDNSIFSNLSILVLFNISFHPNTRHLMWNAQLCPSVRPKNDLPKILFPTPPHTPDQIKNCGFASAEAIPFIHARSASQKQLTTFLHSAEPRASDYPPVEKRSPKRLRSRLELISGCQRCCWPCSQELLAGALAAQLPAKAAVHLWVPRSGSIRPERNDSS